MQSGPYLTEIEGHANVGSICVQFLLSRCFDEGVADATIQQLISDGSFLLENYACRRWFDHIMKCVGTAPYNICRDVESLLDKRENYSFVSSCDSNSATKSLKGFAGFPKKLHTALMDLDSFWRSRRRNFCFKKSTSVLQPRKIATGHTNYRTVENWENLDPLTISKQNARIRRIFEEMLCSGHNHVANCPCAELRLLYGSHIYGCSRPGCTRFRIGFENGEERDSHIQAHYRPFKCDIIDCPYYDLGFTSTSHLQRHINQFHNTAVETSTSKDHRFSQLVEAKAIIADAIDLDDLNLVRDMYTSVRMHSVYVIKACLKKGCSTDMLRLILRICKDDRIVLHWSWYIDWLQVTKVDPELFRILMERDMLKVGSFDDIAKTSSLEMFELFAEYGAEVGSYDKIFRGLLPIRPNAQAEVNALKCMQAMGNAIDTKGYETCLLVLSSRSCSVSIASFCLENGASAEPLWASASPVERASRKTIPEAAQLIEWLREHVASRSKAGREA